MALKKGPLPLCLFTLHQKRPLYFTHATQKLYLLKAISIFILSGSLLLRESPFRIVNCLKLFDCTLLFVYTLKLLKARLWYICLLSFEKHTTCSRACVQLQSGSSAFKQNNAKTTCESLKGAPRHL